MLKTLRNTPTFVEEDFRSQIKGWKSAGIASGARVIIEWAMVAGTGPHVFVFPAENRSLGVQMLQRESVSSISERWADFLEFEYIPTIVDALKREGYAPDIICVDLRPLQVQRARRRAIEAAARAKAGITTH